MSLNINTNVAALNTNRQLFNSSVALDTSLERLSSGFRINSAADDAAGLQISNRLTSQVNGLDQAARNANDGISLIQTADGALEEVTNILHRLKVLCIQAQNGINTQADIDALQTETDELLKEIDRISSKTAFAEKVLLDGTFSTKFLSGSKAGNEIVLDLTQFTETGFGAIGLGLDGLNIETCNSNGPLNPNAINGASNNNPAATGILDFVLTPVTVSGNYKIAVSNDSGVNYEEITVNLIAGTANSRNNAVTIVNAINDQMGPLLNPIIANNPALSSVRTQGSQPNFRIATDLSNPSMLSAAVYASITIGTYDGEVAKQKTTQTDPITDAIALVGDARSYLGATQNRFQSTIRNLSNIRENVSSARSQIRDTDYAAETAELTRSRIVQQASISILAQANTRPQIAQQLLS